MHHFNNPKTLKNLFVLSKKNSCKKSSCFDLNHLLTVRKTQLSIVNSKAVLLVILVWSCQSSWTGTCSKPVSYISDNLSATIIFSGHFDILLYARIFDRLFTNTKTLQFIKFSRAYFKYANFVNLKKLTHYKMSSWCS